MALSDIIKKIEDSPRSAKAAAFFAGTTLVAGAIAVFIAMQPGNTSEPEPAKAAAVYSTPAQTMQIPSAPQLEPTAVPTKTPTPEPTKTPEPSPTPETVEEPTPSPTEIPTPAATPTPEANDYYVVLYQGSIQDDDIGMMQFYASYPFHKNVSGRLIFFYAEDFYLGNYIPVYQTDVRPYLEDGQFGSLYCGDAAELLPALDIRPALIVTSPPYDNLRAYGGHGFDFDGIADALVSAMPEGCVLVWNVGAPVTDGDESASPHEQVLRFKAAGLTLHDTIIALKAGSGGKTWPGRHSREWEACYVFSAGRPSIFNPICDRETTTAGPRWSRASHRNSGNGTLRQTSRHVTPKTAPRSNVWGPYRIGNLDHEATKHPAVMPIALAADHIRTWTNPGDLVLDPMAGSGTTLRAAKDLGRRYVGIEIHEPYCELIRDRMAQSVLPIA